MKGISLGLALLGFAATFAGAAFKSGNNEISFFGTYTNIDNEAGDHAETAFVFANAGHFFTDNIELGLLGMGSWSENDEVYSAGVNGRLHFLTENLVVPYLGAFAMYGYDDSDTTESDDGLIYGPLVGLRFFFTETTNVFVEYQYQLYEGGIGDNIDNEQLVLAGISFKF